ncbi:MAG: biotin/lipoyl-containing protein [Rhodospirillales bacterium]|jgi:acetyl-CoA carboxylase biotin carboxyl carrier protein|nr:hypothetical protein [Rhodospirillaceae bacterium]MDP6428679.1 biotin/lipoyl-containing protein [Rhodospirillales bacterium]MDP6644444.1 biotin/lipoyl-containing protein [Rhodospirillales bacterium]|tara:strand:+ start:3008 stop:3544 length:537 start_codon:yes stop_codon:yes gene_type:complete
MEIDRSDIEQILKLIDGAPFDIIHIEWKGLKVSLIRGSDGAFDSNDLSVFSSPADPGTSAVEEQPQPLSPENGRIVVERQSEPAPTSLRSETNYSGSSLAVKSPTVGTFYRRQEPSAPPFVEEGARVEKGDTLCLIEVMKVFTAITAGKSGTVERILVEDGAMVEFDQTLFLIADDAE